MTSTTTGLPDRYRPISQVAPDEETATGVIRSWRARDRVLNRDVALRVHTPGGPAAREWINRALTAGGLATPALAMVYDAAEGTGADGPGRSGYVVNEWIEGQTLADRLATSGPLGEREARALVRRLAEGVTEAHRVGLAVGGLTPEHVVLRPGGLAGLLSVPAATGTVQGDIAALGSLLELALTGGDGSTVAPPDLADLVRRARSTDPATRLASAATMAALLTERPRTGPQEQPRPDGPGDSGWARRLRDQRQPGAATESVVPGGEHAQRLSRSALPPVPPASALRPGQAGRWPVDPDEDEELDWSPGFESEDTGYPDSGPSFRRRLALVGLPLLALAIVAALALWFGKNVLSVAGSVDQPTGSAPSVGAPAVPTAGAPSSQAPPAVAPGAAVPVTGASVFDPYSDGQPENDDDVPLTHDGNPVTIWSTLVYRGSAQFGKLKPGVGVLYDLGSPQALTGVRIATLQAGTTVEVRTGDAPDGDLDSFPVAAGATLTGDDQVAFRAPVTARYVLVWLTGLVAGSDGYTGSLAEVTPLAAG